MEPLSTCNYVIFLIKLRFLYNSYFLLMPDFLKYIGHQAVNALPPANSYPASSRLKNNSGGRLYVEFFGPSSP